MPAPASEADAQLLIQMAKAINTAAKQEAAIDEDILRLLAFGASADLNPMAAMFGGVVGQEVVKAASGKFHPLFQWLYFDAVEALPLLDKLTAEECAPQVRPVLCVPHRTHAWPCQRPRLIARTTLWHQLAVQGTRYDSQVAVFGKTLQSQLESAKLFLVGAGALGCEFMKNFACMGVATASEGVVVLTDDDVIEKSNLSRQFLFRDWNIGRCVDRILSLSMPELRW